MRAARRHSFLATGAVILGLLHPGALAAQTLDIAGRWTFNRDLSQIPHEVGFNPDWLNPTTTAGPAGGASGGGGGGGGRGSGGRGSPFFMSRESADDAQRERQLTDEVRDPSPHLIITQSPGLITITDAAGHPRSFHPSERYESEQLNGVTASVTATLAPDRLVVRYDVEQNRFLQFSYSRTADPARLVVDVQFIGPGGGDHAVLVYELAVTDETNSAGAPPPGEVHAARPGPDAELKGLKNLGLVVEGLNPAASACGLTEEAVATAVSAPLVKAGFTVRKDADEDTYVYVSIVTSSLTSGLCVSRYDAFLYTHTTTTLPWQTTPVLAQVSLLHQGGLAGGAPATHGQSVVKELTDYVSEFAKRITDAGK